MMGYHAKTDSSVISQTMALTSIARDRGHPLSVVVKCRGCGKCEFRPKSPFIWEAVRDSERLL